MKAFTLSALALTLVLLAGCAAPPDTPLTGVGLTGDYYQLNDRKFDRFVVKDRAEFAKYDKIALFPIQLDGMLILPSGTDSVNRSWTGVTYEEMLPFVESFDELARHLFSEGKSFELTNTGGPNVLAVEFRLKSFRPQTHRAGAGAMGVHTAADITTTEFGELRMQVVLANSQTGELIAVLEDGVTVTPRSFGLTSFGNTTTVDASSRNTTGNQRAAWRRTFRQWLERFRSDLQDLRETAQAQQAALVD